MKATTVPKQMNGVYKAAQYAIARFVTINGLSKNDAENAVLEILKENQKELENGKYKAVIACLNML